MSDPRHQIVAQVEALLQPCDALVAQLRQTRIPGPADILLEPDQLDPQFDEANFTITPSPPLAPLGQEPLVNPL